MTTAKVAKKQQQQMVVEKTRQQLSNQLKGWLKHECEDRGIYSSNEYGSGHVRVEHGNHEHGRVNTPEGN